MAQVVLVLADGQPTRVIRTWFGQPPASPLRAPFIERFQFGNLLDRVELVSGASGKHQAIGLEILEHQPAVIPTQGNQPQAQVFRSAMVRPESGLERVSRSGQRRVDSSSWRTAGSPRPAGLGEFRRQYGRKASTWWPAAGRCRHTGRAIPEPRSTTRPRATGSTAGQPGRFWQLRLIASDRGSTYGGENSPVPLVRRRAEPIVLPWL